MNAILAEQLTVTLTRRVRHWDRRLRLVHTVTWVPRGVLLGLAAGAALATVARLRPWLLPEEVLRLTVALTGTLILLILLVIWGWPRSVTRNARYFDRRFDLKERVSTALELLAGRIPTSPQLVERQLADTAQATARVQAAAQLPLRVRWREVLAVLLLAGALAWLLTNNPHAEQLRARRELDAAISAQAAALEEAIQAVEENTQLSPVEQVALSEPLREALEILSQPGISREEAVAALAEASQALGDLTNGLLPEDTAPYEQAARELAQSEMTGRVANALRQPDLGEAANAVEGLARDLAQSSLNEAQRQDLARQLEGAADSLEAQNPALSQNLRDVAEALRRGDMAAAQQTLNQTAQVLRAQQEQLEQSALAEAARAAQQQTASGQREIAQAGHEESAAGTSEEPSSTASSAAEEQGAAGQGQAQPGAGQAQAGAEAESALEGEDSGAGGAGEGQPVGGQAEEAGEAGAGAGAGESSVPAGQSTGVEQGEGEAALGAGSGEGGAGVDTTTGAQVEGGTGQVPFSAPEGEFHDYTPQHAPTTLGGESDQLLDVGGAVPEGQGLPLQEGELAPNPAGEATLTYSGALRAFRAVVSQALESGRIPLDQRDVIHDYFSSLAR